MPGIIKIKQNQGQTSIGLIDPPGDRPHLKLTQKKT